MTLLTHTPNTHSTTCSSFPSPLLGESDGARSNANWVKCSGKWLFPPGLLNSSSELALSICVCVCVSVRVHVFGWVWECQLFCMCIYVKACVRLHVCLHPHFSQAFAGLLFQNWWRVKEWKCVCMRVCVCVCEIVYVKHCDGGNWGHLCVRPHQLADGTARPAVNLMEESKTAGKEVKDWKKLEKEEGRWWSDIFPAIVHS